jgi:two-component system, NtrC family, sensor kinase
MNTKSDEVIKTIPDETDILNGMVFKNAWEFASDGLCIINSDATILEVNKSFCSIFNVDPDKIINTQLGRIQLSNSNFDSEVKKIFNLKNLSLNFSHSALFCAGQRRLLNHFLHKSTTIDQSNIYYWIVRDRTDYLSMKETLEHEIEEFKITIKSVGDGLIITDIVGKILHINPEAERLTGWKKEFTANKTLDQIFNILDESTGLEHKSVLNKILEGSKKNHFSNNTILISRTGIKTPIAFKGNPIYSDSKIIKGAAIVIRDETENHRKKKELQDSENRFSSVFHSHVAGMILTSPETGLFIEVNNKFLEMTQYEKDEVLGHTVDEINLWPNVTDRERFVKLVLSKKSIENYEQEFRIKNGELRTYNISAEVITIGGANFLLSILNDITESIKIETELRTSRAQLIAALEVANLAPWEFNVETDQFIFNDHFYKLFHTTIEQQGSYAMSSAEYVQKFVHPDDIGYVAREIKKAIDSSDKNFVGDLEHRIIYADGDTGTIAIKYFVVQDNQGRTIRTYGVNQDITKRKLIEQALVNEKEELNVTLRNIRDGVISTNADDKIILTNQAVSEITGWHREELIGKSILDFFEILNTDYTVFAGKSNLSTIFGMKENNQSITSEALEIESRDGSKKIIFCNSAQIKNSQGSLNGYVYVLKDITEQVHIESQLHLSQKMEAVGQLAAGIAHEINTPMQYIMDNTLFLKDSFDALKEYIDLIEVQYKQNSVNEAIAEKRNSIDLDFLLEEIPSAISQTESGIERVSKIVRAMKDFSHPGQKEKVVADLNHGIEVTSVISKNEWKYSADLELNLDKSIPDVYCNIDEINQVILNMIVNAAHAITEKMTQNDEKGKGKIIISTKVKEQYVVIEISDTGSGIPQEIKDRIFDPFFTTKEVGKGTGQGLSIAHNIIVNNHKGSIKVDSTVGVGTNFIISIPYKES